MYQSLLCDGKLFRALRRLDQAMAVEWQARGCPVCSGRLHNARYRRKPRGWGEIEADPAFWVRESLCCAVEGCRRRSTPPSALFLGRRVYFSAVVVLVAVLRQGPTPARIAQLRELVGVSPRTVRRWRRWWLEEFPESPLYRQARGLLRGAVDESCLPRSLLVIFTESVGDRQGLVALLKFLSPLSGSRWALRHGF